MRASWCPVTDGLLAQRLIIMKHMLSLHVPEPHQLERGLCLGQSQRGFHHRGWAWGETGPEASGYICRVCAGTVWGHVRTEMIKVATTRIKSQTRRICRLNLPTKAPAFAVSKKTSAATPSENTKCVYTGWGQMLGADWFNVVVFLIIGAKAGVLTALMDV